MDVSVIGSLVGILGVALLAAIGLCAYLAYRVSASDREKSALINRLGDKVLVVSDVHLDRIRLENERDRIADQAARAEREPAPLPNTDGSQLDVFDTINNPR